jgi:hypothetical protein
MLKLIEKIVDYIFGEPLYIGAFCLTFVCSALIFIVTIESIFKAEYKARVELAEIAAGEKVVCKCKMHD